MGRAAVIVAALVALAALEAQPLASGFWLNAGSVALNRGLAMRQPSSLEQARAALERATVADAGSDRAHQQLGRTYLAMGDPSAAQASLERAIRLEGDRLARYDLGVLQQAAGRPDLAAEQWRQAGAATPVLRLAQDAEFGRRWEDAARLYRLVLEIDPRQPRALGGLGRVLYRGLADDSAEGYLAQAVEIEPEFIVHYLELGEFYRTRGRFEDAAGWFERARAQFPERDEPLLHLGGNLHSQGRYQEAASWYQQVLARNPRSAEGHLRLGRAHLEMGRLDEAGRELETAVGLAPDNAWAHEILGRIYLRQKRYDLAEAECRAALAIDPNNAFYHALLGDVYREQRRVDKAIGAYERALEMDGRLADVRRQLELLVARGR